jgi:LuxR family maltose regulon positive regulatory protein
VLRNTLAHVFSVLGDTVRAQQLIEDARQSPGNFNRMYVETIEGMNDLQGGRLQQAMTRFRMAFRLTQGSSHSNASGNAWAGILYACALYEVQQFDEAERLLNAYLPVACDLGLPGHINAGYIIRARIAFSRGEVERSFELLTEMEHLAHQRQLPRVVANARLDRSRLLLLQGDAQGSLEALERAEDPALISRLARQRPLANEVNYPALARIRWALHFGDARAVLPELEREIARATEQGRLWRAYRLRVLRSLALQQLGDPAAAVREMADVVRHAAKEGFVRLIVDEGPEVGRIVQRLDAMQQQTPVNRSDSALLQHLGRLLDAFGPLPQEALAATAAAGMLMQPLTRKEIQVLQLLAEGCSNAVMSERLKASDSTVRTHLRNINLKLGAGNRVEAVALGRRFGVIR